MATNPYVKPLKGFHPATNLTVNESFKINLDSARENTLDELSSGEGTDESPNRFSEFASYKTSGSINAGLLAVKPPAGGEEMLVCINNKGRLYLFERAHSSLKVVRKMNLARPVNSTPVFSDGVLYSVSRSGGIQAIDLFAETREEKDAVLWQRMLGKSILSEPVATGKMLIVASLEGLFAFEAWFQDHDRYSIGKALWQASISGLTGSPALAHGLIYIGSEDKHFYALEYGGNKINVAWKYKARGAIRGKPYISKTGDLVLFGSQDGNVYAMERATGKMRWPRFIGDAIQSNIISRVDGHNEFFYVGADNGAMYCLNNQGEIIWEFRANGKIRSEPVLKGNELYFGAEDNQFYCLDALDGKKLFQYSTDGNIGGKPVIIGNSIFFGSTDSFIYGVHI